MTVIWSLPAAAAAAAGSGGGGDGDAKDRERLSVSHRGKHKFDTEKFDLETSNKVEITKQYHI